MADDIDDAIGCVALSRDESLSLPNALSDKVIKKMDKPKLIEAVKVRDNAIEILNNKHTTAEGELKDIKEKFDRLCIQSREEQDSLQEQLNEARRSLQENCVVRSTLT